MYLPKGMIVDVYRRGSHDATNKGISSYSDTVLLVGEGIPEITETDGTLPIVEVRYFGNHLQAAPYLAAFRSSMMGGNFIWSSDSRFRELFEYPIPLHDRFETSCRLDDRYYQLNLLTTGN